MTMRPPQQLDLFARRSRNPDANALIAALRRAADHTPTIAGLSPRQARALMRPLPRITVLD